ncbi:hypothetical protein [Gemmobacter sp. LW-1]|uniref:hypothetical protein n=1 Tax=Gemmobacter sp. LW-1 TaxID=1529005 RepID=UPI0006C772E0|nr:hypothetical protein [Gemmobacter sp. LW-1]
MTVFKTYARIAEICRPTADPADKPTPEPAFGDLSEKAGEAEQVLSNWLDVASHNIGEALTAELLKKALRQCTR